MKLPPSHFRESRWYDTTLQRRHLPAPLRGWLLNDSSLTRRLQLACKGRFSVELISLGWARPRLDESQALGTSPRQRALIRQVRLWCDEQPWVFARTVIPVRSLRGAQRRLAHLGNRPLGAYLFAHPALQRSPLQVTQINSTSRLLADCAPLQPRVWGRRSLFRLQGHPLLVSEFFLPTLPAYELRFFHE